MSWFKNVIKRNLPSLAGNRVAAIFHIPEPTKSLLWITDEDISKIRPYSEPSLIWRKLPVQENDELEMNPMYFPSYSGLSPTCRYQYLNWLKDITKPTNLSYVFLYYYGLERNLLVGKYKEAVKEIFRLLQWHDKGTFRSYAQTALLIAGIHKKDTELFKNSNLILDGHTNEGLIGKKLINQNITPKDIIKLSNNVGFTNKRYIKLYPDMFELELGRLQREHEYDNGPLLEMIDLSKLKYEVSSVFANVSIPVKVRQIKIPQLLSDENFKNQLKTLLEKTHISIKECKTSKTSTSV
jgi:hypothetical protein